MHFISVLENVKIYIKTNIQIAPTCFGLRPSSGSLHMSLAKVAFIELVKVRHFAVVWQHVISSVCAVEQYTAHSTHTTMDLT